MQKVQFELYQKVVEFQGAVVHQTAPGLPSDRTV
jgi:hypothetical protein